MTTICKIIKKIIFSCFLLYGYNVLAVPLNIIIPINIVNILIISIFGVSSLFSLILIHVLIF
ncbi:MAG: pro-sigmaK processing inhibitor BofA family protein [Bacilli bacterium]|nr:pro-sigmaK processing inhibitor BofA family protein [Bacilli bacterium]